MAIPAPAVLAALERRGLDFASRLAPVSGTKLELAGPNASAAWLGIIAPIERELAEVARTDSAAGVSVARFSHRLFDARFFTSPKARMELVGVISRLDRAPFHPARCGETRLVYRLAYETEAKGRRVRSRLPMTIVLEYVGAERPLGAAPEVACAEAARAWQLPRETETPERTVERLTVGPLAPAALGLESLHQLAVNVQAVRWPSTVRPDLGGHAEYLLLAFDWDRANGTFVERPLENTPDAVRLRSDTALRAELVDWIAHNVASIDDGTAQVPERFLTRRARSVTPHGPTRLENRPYKALFRGDALVQLESALARSPRSVASRRTVRSTEGLLRRLDDLTCQGCHQSRSVAGFHWLGSDEGSLEAGNALVSPFSHHVEEELMRRQALASALARGARADFFRPLAERATYAGYGARCGLGDASFADWTCDEGLTCQPYDVPRGERDLVGTCLPKQPAVGDPCEFGPVETRLDPRRDRVIGAQKLTCAGHLACNTSEVGFPGGMCSSDCNDEDPAVRCGPIAVLAPFNACLARGEPFPTCLAQHVRPAGLRGCSRAEPCRDDYICAQADPKTPAQGVCLPPYFLFQLRVDGHTP